MSTPDRLLDALDDVIAQHGPSGVTLRRVGEQAGLSHTAGAHHFDDKPGLFTAYLIRGYERLAIRIETATGAGDARKGLRDAAVAYAQFALDEPSVFSVMDRLELARVDTPELWAARERGFFALFGLVERHQADGWATGRTTLDLLATCWAFVHGFVDLWVGGPLWAPYDGLELIDVLTRLVDDLLDAIGALSAG